MTKEAVKIDQEIVDGLSGKDVNKIVSTNGITFFKTGIKFDDSVDFKTWESQGHEFAGVISMFHNHMKWWLGDWINHGESAYGEKYSQALDETMYAHGSLRNCAYVCRKIPLENRNPGMSFEHHYEVAKLPPGDQAEWLAEADINNWTVRQLRKAIKGEPFENKALPNKVEPNKVGDKANAPESPFESWWLENQETFKSLIFDKNDLYGAAKFAWSSRNA